MVFQLVMSVPGNVNSKSYAKLLLVILVNTTSGTQNECSCEWVRIDDREASSEVNDFSLSLLLQ